MSRAVHFYRGLGFEIVHGGEEVEFTSFLAGKSFLRRESRKRLVMLGPEANQMTTSKTIAGLIGPTLVAIAAGMLLNIGSFPELAEQVSRDPALIFVSGILLFVAGLAIVRAHNRWTKEWPVLVTILGWLAILSGLARMLFPTGLAAIAGGIGQTTGAIIPGAIVLLGLGAFLSFKAYRRD